MTNTAPLKPRLFVATCETCGGPILEGDHHHRTADGCWLCADHAPMLSGVLAEYERILDADGPFDPGELARTEAEIREDVRVLRAELKIDGDRKVFHHWPGGK